MSLPVQCPGCGKQYKVNDDLAGKTVRCGCGQSIQVLKKAAPLTPAPEQTPPVKAAPPVRSGTPPVRQATADDGTPQIDVGGGTPSLNVASGTPASAKSSLAKRRKQSQAMVWVLAAGGGGALLLIVLVLVLANRGGNNEVADKDSEQKQEQKDGATAGKDDSAGKDGGSGKKDDSAAKDGQAKNVEAKDGSTRQVNANSKGGAGKDARKKGVEMIDKGRQDDPKKQQPVPVWLVRADSPKTRLSLPADVNFDWSPYGKILLPNVPSDFVALFRFERDDRDRVKDLYSYDIHVMRLSDQSIVSKIKSKDIHTSGSYTMSADGRHVVTTKSTRGQKAITVYSLETGAVVSRIPYEAPHVRFLDFAGPERIAAGLSNSPSIAIYHLKTGKLLQTINLVKPLTEKHHVAISPLAQYLAAFHIEKEGGSHSGKIRVYNLTAAQELGAIEIPGMPSFVRPSGISFSDDGGELSFLYNWGPTAENYRLVCFDLPSRRLVVDHEFPNKTLSTSGTHRTFENAVDLGWLVKGHQWINRKTGQITKFEIPPTRKVAPSPLATRMIARDVALVVWEKELNRVPTLNPVVLQLK